MIWSAVAHVFSILLELTHSCRMSDLKKDVQTPLMPAKNRSRNRQTQ